MKGRGSLSRGSGEARQEAEFLASYDVSKFERPSLTVDVVLVTTLGEGLGTLVVRRADYPHKGRWALPGGFVHMTESLDAAAERVLAQKTGLSNVFVEQLYTFGDPRRDPRTRVVTVAYYALVHGARLERRLPETSIARVQVPWEGEAGGPVHLRGDKGERLTMAFDHEDIVGMAVKRLRGKLAYTPVGFQLLPRDFTLLELQRVHEAVLGRPVNKDSFRRKMLASGDLEKAGKSQEDVVHRPAELYRFAKRSAL